MRYSVSQQNFGKTEKLRIFIWRLNIGYSNPFPFLHCLCVTCTRHSIAYASGSCYTSLIIPLLVLYYFWLVATSSLTLTLITLNIFTLSILRQSNIVANGSVTNAICNAMLLSHLSPLAVAVAAPQKRPCFQPPLFRFQSRRGPPATSPHLFLFLPPHSPSNRTPLRLAPLTFFRSYLVSVQSHLTWSPYVFLINDFPTRPDALSLWTANYTTSALLDLLPVTFLLMAGGCASCQ